MHDKRIQERELIIGPAEPLREAPYPRSLRQALAYLECRPFVCLTTRYSNIVAKSRWWYQGACNGVLWFEPFHRGHGFIQVADTGLELFGHEHEIGLEFSPGGFAYTRGLINIAITYVNPLEALR
jgi:hypothetical protein